MLTFKQAAVAILKNNNEKPLSYIEITNIAIAQWLITTDWKTPEHTMWAYITQDIKDYWDNSFFHRISNGKYIINNKCNRNINNTNEKKSKNEIKIEKKEDMWKQFTGKWWEYLVCSKLLFRGYYACLMSVDDWIDIIAIKGKKKFLIQVKTSNLNRNRTFNFSIGKKSFEKYIDDSPYYIFVIHSDIDICFIIPNEKLNKLFEWKKQTDKDYYNISIKHENDGYFIGKIKLIPEQRDLIK